ncbi:HAD family hydrolase [Paenibacillus cymbidii]|uniref:HAD family hydrolase n=1 Tax=Paenibacillus cymbidii TaxID=1639034 RepID=UPI0010822324|nr:HAD family hydrolase [Paenibacillus cymbidii]
MEQQTILFDLDDTLVHCNKYFELVLEQFVDQMQTWYASDELSAESIRATQLEIDTSGVSRHGFTPKHFPQSLVDTYRHYAALTGREESEGEREWLIKLGSSVYDYEVEPYPYMVETLDKLRAQGHELILYTGGVAAIQRKKVKALSLEAYFGSRVHVSLHKTASSLETILRREKRDRGRTWMIGNSLRTDIVPALETGIHAVYIPAVLEWSYNMIEVTIKPKGAFLTLRSLSEVPNAIASYRRQPNS